MKVICDSNEHEMVLAFLKAEMESPRFGKRYASELTKLGYERSTIIDNANLESKEHNQIRILLLNFRGYKSRTLLFTNFPLNVKWKLVRLEYEDLNKLKYANYLGSKWIELSRGSRLVIDGAKNIDKVKVEENGRSINDSVKAIAKDLENGKQYPELIGVEGQDDEIILVEGHTRSTAYAITKLKGGVEIIVGNSPRMTDWSLY